VIQTCPIGKRIIKYALFKCAESTNGTRKTYTDIIIRDIVKYDTGLV